MTAKKQLQNTGPTTTNQAKRSNASRPSRRRPNQSVDSGTLSVDGAAIRHALALLAQSKGRRHVQFTEERRELFLAALEAGFWVDAAALLAGVSRRSVYYHRNRDADFAELWDLAREASRDAVEERLIDIALYGEMDNMATVRAAEVVLLRRERSPRTGKAKASEQPKVVIVYEKESTPD